MTYFKEQQGLFLQIFREKEGLSLENLSSKVGIEKDLLFRIESGTVDSDKHVFFELCKALSAMDQTELLFELLEEVVKPEMKSARSLLI